MARRQNHHAGQATALLTLAGQKGWSAITAAQLAKAAKMTQAAASALLGNPAHAMRLIADYVTAAAHGKYRHDQRNTPREALFEILMLRIDVLQHHRAGFLALHKAARNDPRLAAALAQALYPQCAAILNAAAIQAEPPQTLLLKAGLGAIYGLALCTWRRDESADLAKTMATLDRQLGRAETLMRFLEHRVG